MKSKLPPLALSAALAACVGVLGLAYWMLTSNGGSAAPEASFEPASLDSSHQPHVAPTQPVAPKVGANAAGDGSRVAFVDESAARVLPQVEFEVRTSLDRPLAGARLLLFRSEEVLGKRECDAAGLAHFDADGGSAQMIVVAKDVPATSRSVTLAAGRQVITLERGVFVSGRVRTVDQSSLEGVRLTLTSDRPLVDESSWPAEVKSELDKLHLVANTNDSGQFEFTGLGSPWSGKLELSETHELLAVSGVSWTPGSDSIRLDDPIEGLLLDVAALPMARGRVVLSAGGPGAEHASVNGSLTFEQAIGDEEAISANFNGRTDKDGRFALPIQRNDSNGPGDPRQRSPWPQLRAATLSIDGGENIPRRRLELSGAQLPENFDFGELVLERGGTLQFIVVDALAKPLAGAVGRLDGERSEPTDENGHSSIAYAPGVNRPLSVSLDGYRDGRVDVPKEVSDALNVVLTRTNRLTVVVTGPDEVPIVDVAVQVSGQVPQNRRGRGRANEQRTDGQGKTTFSDLPVGTPTRVSVRDAIGGVVADQSITLGAEEWRTLPIQVAHALLAFSGVVRDEAGLALAEASIEFGVSQGRNNNNVSTRSDADGRFSFSGLNNPVGTLRVRKSGFAPVTIVDFQIPPPGVIADIRMERGLRLTLRVVDERGAPVRGENLRLELAGERPFQGRRSTDNEWDFSNLPRESMKAIGVVGAREYRQDIEPLNGNQDFRVPVQGGLEVGLRLDPALLQAPLRIVLRARDDRRIGLTQNLEPVAFQTRKYEPVLPGEYQLNVSQFQQTDQRGEWVNIGATQKITIAPGASQHIELER